MPMVSGFGNFRACDFCRYRARFGQVPGAPSPRAGEADAKPIR